MKKLLFRFKRWLSKHRLVFCFVWCSFFLAISLVMLCLCYFDPELHRDSLSWGCCFGFCFGFFGCCLTDLIDAWLEKRKQLRAGAPSEEVPGE